MQSKKNDMQYWEKYRKLGKTRYILLFGVIVYGMTVCAGTILIKYLTNPSQLSMGFIVFLIIVHAFCGCVYGNYTWNTAEKRYQKEHDNRL